jgi:enoyl-CoA hydratase
VLDGRAAVEHGLAGRCVDSEAELLPAARRLATRAAARDPELVRRARDLLAATAGLPDPTEARAAELDAQQWSPEPPGVPDPPPALRDRTARPTSGREGR